MDIKFNEEKHEYHIEGKKALSCTQFISQFFPEFDADKMSKFVAKRRRDKGELNSKGKPITARDVKKEWSDKNEAAITRGNRVHDNMESLINLHPNLIERLATFGKEELLLCEWLANNGHSLETLMSEQIVGDEELLIAGTIDVIGAYKSTTSDAVLIDWKTNTTLEGSYGKLKHPIMKKYDLSNSKLTKYFLQLNVYKYLVEKITGIYVREMIIVHVSEERVTEFYVPDLSIVVGDMMEYRRKELENEK